MEMDVKRLSWPDLCKGIAIILVVVGHAIGYVTSYGGGIESNDLPMLLGIKKWIYSFHMPLFFFVSGYLQRFSEERKHQTLHDVKGKLLGFIVPYVSFSIVFWAFKMIFSGSVSNPLMIKNLLLIVIFPLSDLWFLYALCILYIIHILTKELRVDESLLFVVAIAVSAAFSEVNWNKFLAETALPKICANITYYVTGMSFFNYAQNEKVNNNYCEKYGVMNTIILMILGAVFCFINIQIPAINGILRVLSAYCSILGLYYLSSIVRIMPIQFLGSNSLYIYLVHDYAICAVVIALYKFGISNSVLSLEATAAGLLFSIFVIRICSKVKIFDAVFKPSIYLK